jgi:rubrerythrin
MPEYIDREKIFPNGVFYVCESHPEKSLDELINRICDAPTEDVQKVKHGKWVDIFKNKYSNQVYRCSICKGYPPLVEIYDELNTAHLKQELSDYCPYCGAKMGGVHNG